VPATAALPAVNVPRNSAEPLSELKAAVTPAGSPAADITMFPRVPVTELIETAVAACAPWTTLKLAGASATVKFAETGAVTLTVTEINAARLPEAPLTVN
jgi:hypothetical protein